MLSAQTASYKKYEIHTWLDDGGYYSCRSATVNSIYSESDDLGPFDNRSLAFDAQVEDIEAFEETA